MVRWDEAGDDVCISNPDFMQCDVDGGRQLFGFNSIESVCNSIVLTLKRRDESRGDRSGK